MSVIVNALVAVSAVAAVCLHSRKAPWNVLLRFFTVLSNLFCAAACLVTALCRLAGAVPGWVLAFKYVGTAAVMVTFLTVLLFLGPSQGGYKKLFSGPDLWLHLLCPLLALLSLLAWDRVSLPFWAVLLGTLPVLAYGILYLYKVLYAPEEKRWKDFYGFNRGGRWPVSFAAMLAGGFLVSLALWLV